MTSTPLANWRRRVAPSLGAGLGAWGAYAVVEAFWSSIVPWLAGPRDLYRPVHPGFTLAAVALWLAVGFFGGLGLSILPIRRDEVRRRLAIASVTGIFTLHVFESLATRGMIVALIAGLAVLASLLIPRLPSDPWIAAAVLLGAAAAGSELADRQAGVPRVMISHVVVVSVVLVLLVMAVRRFVPRPWIVALVASIAVVGTSLALDQHPLEAPRKAAGPKGTKPHVVLIVLDTLRADHTSLYGYGRRTTPWLEDFGRGATVYRRAVSGSDLTLSSHATLFTGLYAETHGSNGNTQASLDERLPTLAQIVKRHGWNTEAVVANHSYLSPVYGLARGFNYYDVRVPLTYTAEPTRGFLRERLRNLFVKLKIEPPARAAYRTADVITDEALARVGKARQSGEALFLFLNYMETHYPYHAPPPFDTRFPGKDPAFTKTDYHELRRVTLSHERSITAAERAHLESQYDGALLYLDTQLARLFDGLRRAGLYDDALIIVTADHGEGFGEHDVVEHATSVWQELIHVPLIVKYPGQTAGGVDERLVAGVDIFPTILTELKLAVPSRTEGLALRAPAAASRAIFAESHATPENAAVYPRFKVPAVAMLLGPHKLIRDTDRSVMLYNLIADPREEKRLTDDSIRASFVETLTRRFPARPLSTERKRRDAETERRLRSLGYLQ